MTTIYSPGTSVSFPGDHDDRYFARFLDAALSEGEDTGNALVVADDGRVFYHYRIGPDLNDAFCFDYLEGVARFRREDFEDLIDQYGLNVITCESDEAPYVWDVALNETTVLPCGAAPCGVERETA